MLTGFLFIIALVSFFSPEPRVETGWSARDIRDSSQMLVVGEMLEYKVSYSFFNLGIIKIEVVDKEQRNGRDVYKTRAIIDSNPGLSWLIEAHIRFYSEMDGDVFSYSWIGDDSSRTETSYRKFVFDYDSNRVFYEQGKKLSAGERKPEKTDTIAVKNKCQDGLSLFFYARENVRTKQKVDVPTFIDNKEATTFINFMNQKTDADIDSVDYPIDVVKFDGKANYVGVVGLTGGFSGWFSNDDARIPIVARMSVILGSVKIQLMRWNRPGWRPPKYVEEK